MKLKYGNNQSNYLTMSDCNAACSVRYVAEIIVTIYAWINPFLTWLELVESLE